MKRSLLFCLLCCSCSSVPNDISHKAAVSCQSRGFSGINDVGQPGWVIETPYEHCYNETVNKLLSEQ
jgi:hypothetical protein